MLVLLEVFDRSVILSLQRLVDLLDKLLLLFSRLEHTVKVLLILRIRLLFISADVVLFIDAMQLLSHLLHPHIEVIDSLCEYAIAPCCSGGGLLVLDDLSADLPNLFLLAVPNLVHLPLVDHLNQGVRIADHLLEIGMDSDRILREVHFNE